MTPAIAGVITGVPMTDEPDTAITVASATFDRTTTVLVRESLGGESFVAARIVLDEEGRRELIELLGGTP